MFSFEPSVSLSAGQLSTAPRGGPAGSLVDRNAIQVPKSPILFLLMRNVSFPLFINDVGRLVQGEIRMCIRPIEKEREKDGVIVLLLLSDRPSLSCLSGRSEPSNSPSAKETSGNETLFFRLPRILKKTGRDVVCKKRENSPIESSYFFFPLRQGENRQSVSGIVICIPVNIRKSSTLFPLVTCPLFAVKTSFQGRNAEVFLMTGRLGFLSNHSRMKSFRIAKIFGDFFFLPYGR